MVASSSPPSEPEHAQLAGGHLSRARLTSLSLASFIPAVGMALLPMLMVSAAGPNAVYATVLTALLISCVGICVVTFARRYVASGALCSYIREVFGPWARFVSAGALLTGYAAQIAGIACTVGIFSSSFAASQGISEQSSHLVQTIAALAAIAIAAVIAYRGVDTSVRIAVTLAVLSVPLMLVITIASANHTHLHLATQFHFATANISGILLGVAAGAAWLVAFESSAAMASETKDPHRNVPLAVMAVPIVLGTLYIACTIADVPGLLATADQIQAGVSAPAALALNAGLGRGVASVTDAVLAVACFAGLIGLINYGSRCAMAISEDALLPSMLADIHPRMQSPYRAIAMMALAGAGLIVALTFITGNLVSVYTLLASVITLIWVVPYLLICVGAVVLNHRLGERKPLILLAAAVGAIGISWLYVTAWVSPAPPPADVVAWLAPAILVAAALLMAGTYRRLRRPVAPATEPQLAT